MAGGRIKNTVETTYTSKGAKKTAKESESIGRAQTRMGQASASTGRQFSAQASGLGGLVAAYAGAAANIFALQQAFAALQRAAQAETIVRGTKTLALEIGESGARILASIEQITEGQLTLQEAAQSVNIALSAGFSGEQIEKLTAISMKASRALGRSLTDAMTRVTRGAAKMEPELLDELGIFTRIDPAVEAYAAKLNVAASSLTNYERRQAFANAVIEEGEKKFSAINTSVPSSQKSIEQLLKVLNDLAISFGQLVANTLTPFLDFISKNAGIALLAFGGILALVFGKAAQLIGGFVGKAMKDLTALSNKFAITAAESKGSFKVISEGASALAARQAKEKPLDRAVSQDQGASFVKGFKRSDTKALQEAQSRFGTQISPEQMTKDMKLFKNAQDKMTGSTRQTSRAFNNAGTMAATYETALKKAGAQATIFTWISTKLSWTLTKLASAFRILMSSINILFAIISAVQLLGTFMGFDALKYLKDMVMDTSQAFTNFGKGITGAVASAAGGIKKLELELKGLNMQDEDLEKLGGTLRTMFKGGMSGAESANKQMQKFIDLQGVSLGKINLAINGEKARHQVLMGNLNEEIAKRSKLIKDAEQALRTPGGTIQVRGMMSKGKRARSTISNESPKLEEAIEKRTELMKEHGKILDGLTIKQTNYTAKVTEANDVLEMDPLDQLIRSLEEAAKGYSKTTDAGKQNALLNAYLVKQLKELGPAYELIGAVAEQSGISTDKVSEIFKTMTSRGEGLALNFKLLGKEIDNTKVTFADLDKTEKKLIVSETILVNTLNDANKSFEEGTATSETLSKKLGGLNNRYIELKDNLDNLRGGGTDAQKEQLKAYLDEIGSVRKLNRELKVLETRGKALTDIYGKYMKVLDQAFAKGELSEAGGIATTPMEKEKNRAKFLESAITQGTPTSSMEWVVQEKAKEESEREAGRVYVAKFSASQKKMWELRQRALKIVAGMTIELVKEVEKERKKQFRIGEVLNRQKKILLAQLEIVKQQNVVAEARADEAIRVKRKKEEFDISKANIDLEKERMNFTAQGIIASEKQIELGKKQLEINRKIADHEITMAALQTKRTRQKGKARLTEELADMQFFPGLFTEEDTRAKKKELLDYEHTTAMDLIQAEEDQINRKFTYDQTALNNEIAMLQTKKQNNDTLLTEQKALFVLEDNLRKAEQAEEIKAITEKNTILEAEKVLITKKETHAKAQLELQRIQDKHTAEQERQKVIGLEAQWKTVQTFAEATSEKTPFVQAIGQFVQAQAGKFGMDKDKALASFNEQLGTYVAKPGAETDIQKLRRMLEANITLRDNMRGTRGEINKEKFGSATDLLQKQIDGSVTLLENLKKRQIIENEIEAKKQAIQNTTVEATGKQLAAELKILQGRKTVLDNTLQEDLERIGIKRDAETQAYDAAVNHLKRQGDLTRQFGSEVSQAFQSDLKGSFNEFFASVREGKGVMESAKDAWNSFIQKIIGSLQDKITDKFIAPVLEAGMDSLMGSFFNAAGGPVHMAGGGAIHRDRVPAMLEPGEFVIRKPMAKAIGGPALHAMNSTGKGATPKIEVVVNNEGSPKDASAQVKPQIDVDKIVVEIVTRDLRNNGPIRKSLRAGGGG